MNSLKSLFVFFILSFFLQLNAQIQQISPVNYSDIEINDPFWSPKIEDVAKNAIQVCIYQTEVATPRIQNYENVAKNNGSAHQGIYYDDSDVYKALEAMAYSLHSVPNPKVEAKADEWIDKIAAAQQPDGYLNTYYSLEGLENRWSDMERHEAYCAGHLIEAAIAYFQATGKQKLLDVAIRYADHIDQTFRIANRPWVTGHQEIELALVKLYRVTGNKNYLKLSEWFLEQRGHGYGKGKIWDQWKDPAYCQDEKPVKEQTEITGHAVRAMYMYTGIADVASITEDEDYIHTMLKVWEDVVHRNTYITGGIGSAGRNEGFSIDYDLPNEEAYCETCASVGMVLWNQRMNWLTGDAKYMDVLERSLYNSALDGISLDGKQFFYPNPLASSGQHARKDWFGTACCPSNISRMISSIGNYIYGKSENALWVQLFIGNTTIQKIGDTDVIIKMETEYPWDDQVRIHIDPQNEISFSLHVRIPGWTMNEAMPGNLYKFLKKDAERVKIVVNGEKVNYQQRNGYAMLNRIWKKGDQVVLNLPIKPRKVASSPSISENKNRLALQYGPLVYCIEGVDNQNEINNIILPYDTKISLENYKVTDERVISLNAEVPVFNVTNNGMNIQENKKLIRAIPYYTWCNRGSNNMLVWLPTKIKQVKIE